jgi:hypothetical protein
MLFGRLVSQASLDSRVKLGKPTGFLDKSNIILKEGSTMINIQELGLLFSEHVTSCKSCSTVCRRNAAFESWFRVELIPVLGDIGYTNIVTDYNYPNIKRKADLAINLNEGKIVFELKSFVNYQDSNKKEKYPEQVTRLKNLLIDDSSEVIQVITFTTFAGYTDTSMSLRGAELRGIFSVALGQTEARS